MSLRQKHLPSWKLKMMDFAETYLLSNMAIWGIQLKFHGGSLLGTHMAPFKTSNNAISPKKLEMFPSNIIQRFS